MSRSIRKKAVLSMTNAASDKQFKTAENRRARRANNQQLDEMPSAKGFGNPWKSEKDGKHYWAKDTSKDMRD